jgi:hypothetical protein
MMFIIYMLRYVKTYWALYPEKTKYNHYIGNIVVRCIFCPRISIPAPNQNVIMQIYLSSRPKSCRNILLPPFRNVVWFTSLTIVTYSFDNLVESYQTWQCFTSYSSNAVPQWHIWVCNWHNLTKLCTPVEQKID